MFRFEVGNTTRAIAGVIALALVLAQKPAMADEEGENYLGIGPEIALMVLGMALVEGYLLIGGTAVGGSHLVKAVQGKRPSSGQLAHGYILSGLNIVIGSLILADYHSRSDWLATVGAVQLGIGLADLGFTIWSHVQEDGNKQYISISPMVIPDKGGNTAFGIGIQMAGW